MNKELEIGVKPILDTKILHKQLNLNAPKLKIDIDPGYLERQIQNAVKKAEISPVNISAHVHIPKDAVKIDTSVLAEQIQAAMGNLQNSPVSIPVNLNINEGALRTALNTSMAALPQSISMPEIQVKMPKAAPTPGIPQQAAANPAKPIMESGLLNGFVNTGKEAFITYNRVTDIIGTMIGLMDGSAVGNFTKSFD